MTFKPMLANVYIDQKLRNPYVQPKLDGVRCIAARKNDVVTLTSRNGKPLSIPHIEEKLQRILPEGVTLDGELYIHGLRFDDVSSLVRRYRNESLKLEYCVYDCFLNECPQMPFKFRYQVIENIGRTGAFTLVSTMEVQANKTVDFYHDGFVKAGFEGAILRGGDSPYKNGRSTQLLKVKEFQDAEYPITGFKSGKGKHANCVVWECETEAGRKFNVTPRMSEPDRREAFTTADAQIGRMLTVQYFELTANLVPRFPVGLGIREAFDLDEPETRKDNAMLDTAKLFEVASDKTGS